MVSSNPDRHHTSPGNVSGTGESLLLVFLKMRLCNKCRHAVDVNNSPSRGCVFIFSKPTLSTVEYSMASAPGEGTGELSELSMLSEGSLSGDSNTLGRPPMTGGPRVLSISAACVAAAALDLCCSSSSFCLSIATASSSCLQSCAYVRKKAEKGSRQ